MKSKSERLFVTFTLALGLTLALLLALSIVEGWLVGGGMSEVAHAQGPDGHETYYVAPGANCGAGYTPCYASVQAAVDAADDPGDVIKVAAGTYTDIHARAGITQVVYISKTVTVRGGYTATNWDTPDPEAHPTTLDAQGQGRVLYITGDISPTIEGLRLTGGDASGLGGNPWGDDSGGGVYISLSTATIRNCTVYSNTASATGQGYGGGLYLRQSDATLTGNTVQGNIASTANAALGGGLYLYYSNATLTGNTVQGNTGSSAYYGYGGGLYLYHSDATLSGNTVQGNTGSSAYYGYGGGLYLYHSDAATLEGNTVQSNTASSANEGRGGGLHLLYSDATLNGNMVQGNISSTDDNGYGGGLHLVQSNATLNGNTVQGNTSSTDDNGYGGGLYLLYSAATLRGNTVLSNTATLSATAIGQGGGLYVYRSSPFTLTNNVIADNQANTEGSGLWLDGSSVYSTSGRLLHTTIADNHGSGQGVYVGDYTTLVFTNTIIAGHGSVGITVTDESTVTLAATLWYSSGMDISGTVVSATNIYGDPAFADPPAWDYHLTAGSAAIDAGVDAGVNNDIDGLPRPIGVGPEIGAYEYRTCWARLNDDPTDYLTVQAAVDASTQSGDVVKVAGYCSGVQARGGITQTVYLSKTVTLRGGYTTTNWTIPDPAANPTTLDALGRGRALYITGDPSAGSRQAISPTIEGLRLTGGDATGLGGDPWENDSGGGVCLRQAAAIVSNCTIYSNTASATGWGYGGGLYLYYSSATLTGNTVFNNIASTANRGNGGGLYLYYSNATLTGNTVLSNIASTTDTGYGGGLHLVQSDATLTGNTVVSNIGSSASLGRGGGLYLNQSDATLEGNTVQSNTGSSASESDGGGLYLVQSDATLRGNTVQGNTASSANRGYGGGLYLLSSAATLTDNTVISNTGSTADRGYGGGLYLDFSAATLTGNTVRGNTGSSASYSYGGGLYLRESNATLTGNTVQGNTGSSASYSYGGGLYLEKSAATLTGNVVLSNTASSVSAGRGGGLYLVLSNAALEGNTVLGNTATLNGTATGRGGGLYVFGSSPFTLTNNLVADNHANDQGSGLWLDGSSVYSTSGRLLHTTIADNHSSGQGVYVGYHTTLAFTNTIIAGHSSVGLYTASSSTVTLAATLWHGNGMDTGGESAVVSSTNVYGEPAFADPAVWDYHLTAGSAAIDAGVDAGVTTDLDGDPRPQGGGYDVGADEATVPVVVLTKSGPEQVGAGEPITYTLTVTNSSSVAASALVITDALPAGAVFVTASDGGLRVGDVVSWTAPSLGPMDRLTRTFTVTATATITNNDYRVSCAEGVSAAGSVSVVTNVIGERKVYLPLVLRNFLEWRIAGQ